MNKLISMREALASPDYFGTNLAGPTWASWRIILTAIVGEELTEDERLVFTSLTGREREPCEPVRAFFGVVGRRAGKTMSMAVLATYLAVCVDNRSVLAPGEVGALPIIAVSKDQAKQFFDYVMGIFNTVPRFKGLVESAKDGTVRLVSGIEIRITTASWRTVRSITAIACIAEELAFWRVEGSVNPDEEIIAALKPALLTTRGMLIGISSPYSQAGVLYKNWAKHWGPIKNSEGQPTSADPRTLVVKAASLTLNPSLPPEEIADQYRDDPVRANSEYGGNWRPDVAAFISRESVDACIDKNVFERGYDSNFRYTAHVDPSGGSNDSYTLAIAHKDKDGKARLDLVREIVPPFSPEDVTENFAADLKRYKIKTVKGDRYAGEFPRELFRKQGIAYEVSEPTASAIFQELLPLINSGKVSLLDNARLINQLCALERRTGLSGKDSIGHPRGGHDDLINAAAGALINAVSPKRGRIIVTGYASIFDNIVLSDTDPDGYQPGEEAGSKSGNWSNPLNLKGHELRAAMPSQEWLDEQRLKFFNNLPKYCK